MLESQISSQPPRVFISSKQDELASEREYLKEILRSKGIDSFVFEKDAGARHSSAETAFLAEVANSDIYLGIFYKKYSGATIEEYNRAYDLGKPCLIYIKRIGRKRREPLLRDFLDSVVKKRHTYKEFDSILELNNVCNDVMNLLTRGFRELDRLKTLAFTELRPSQLSKLVLSNSLRLSDSKLRRQR